MRAARGLRPSYEIDFMDDIEGYRRRLAALSNDRAGNRGASLADYQAAQSRLRQLKRDVLARVAGLRSDVQERAAASLEGPPTLREAWRRRREGAGKLLSDVQQRVIGMVTREDGDAIEALTRINEEIDARLERLAGLERSLARRPEGDARTEPRPRPAEDEAAGNDDLYAAVGAAVQRGEKADAHCPHCGRGLAPDDRFCRRCGHRLV